MMNKSRIGKRILFLVGILVVLCGCGRTDEGKPQVESSVESDTVVSQMNFENMHWEAGDRPVYAECFQIEKYEDYRFITIVDSGRFLLVSGENEVPENVPEDVVVLHTPLTKVYQVATSGFDAIRQIGALDRIRFSGTKESDLYIEEAVNRIKSGEMLYAGKYSAPDYELLISEGCQLAIESTMINHSPATREKLESLGIPVMVERSSYEPHPLGRMEWVKLYGALLDKEEEAKAFFDQALMEVQPVLEQEDTECKVAFFYVNTNGVINIRKSSDYIAKMVDLAGGIYVPKFLDQEEENALSTMNVQMEDFYLAVKDADILIYNGTIAGSIESVDELVAMNALFADFKAVQEHRVYCTGKNVFQETTAIGTLMEDMSILIHEKEDGELKLLKKLK